MGIIVTGKNTLKAYNFKGKRKFSERRTIKAKEKPYKNRVYGKSGLKDIKCHILSSNTYSLMINNRGEGFSKNGNIFINRWRRDFYLLYGQFIYIKDLKIIVFGLELCPNV